MLGTMLKRDAAESKKCCTEWLVANMFLLVTLAGVVAGIILGFVLRPMDLHPDTVLVISYPGELFMRVLKLMILPFVISCLIIGTASLNIHKNGRIAVRTLTFFVVTSAINVIIGLSLALLIHPGSPDMRLNTTASIDLSQTSILDGFLDMGRNLVADNLFHAAFEQTYTQYVPVTNSIINETLDVVNFTDVTSVPMKRQLNFRDGTNTLGIIFFCLMFGSVLGTMGPEKTVVIEFFTTIYRVLMKMLMGAIWFTPIGVGSIICGKIISIADLSYTLTQLSWFIMTMAAGIFLYQLIILQFIFFIFVRKNPYKFYFSLGPSILTAFATASKSAALPITFQIFDEKLKVDQRISRFIMPIGTINMDGTALFLTVSIMFIAQINNIPLGIGHLITIALSCTAASMSSATVPSAALVLVLMLCSTINAPTEDVSLLFAVDWFVDRMRTTNNLLGDCYACAVVESLSKKELELSDQEEEGRPYYDTTIPENSIAVVPEKYQQNGDIKMC